MPFDANHVIFNLTGGLDKRTTMVIVCHPGGGVLPAVVSHHTQS